MIRVSRATQGTVSACSGTCTWCLRVLGVGRPRSLCRAVHLAARHAWATPPPTPSHPAGHPSPSLACGGGGALMTARLASTATTPTIAASTSGTCVCISMFMSFCVPEKNITIALETNWVCST